MNKTNLSFIALAMAATFVSCSNENDVANNASSEYINTVRVTVEDFKPETPETRTAYTVDNTGFHFSWAEGDALGIYPVGGDQVKFPISAGGGSKSATFDGGSWKLRSNFQYAAYYPFSTANYTIAQTALPVSYTGQTQNGNGSTAHVGAYDYLACAATQPNGSGGVDLQMKQLGAFLRLQLTMPKADTYSSVVLESDGAKFVTTGTFDLTAATPAITATATSSTFTINLTNVSTSAANEVVTVYALVAPANLSAANIKVTVHGAGQTTYAQTVSGKNFQAGKAYNIAIETFPSGTNASGEDVSWEESAATTGVENGHAWVDLGLSVKWATMNVGATNPEDYGLYFAWGETIGYTSDTSDGRSFDHNSLKYCNGTAENGPFSKYVTSNKYGTIDNKTTLESEDDAATMNWSGAWRIPTQAEWQELINSCTWLWVTQNNIKGYKITGNNGNNIFLPAAGSRYETDIYKLNENGWYWSSTLYSSDNSQAYRVTFYEWNNCHIISQCYRIFGNTVRAVCTK